VTLQELLPKMKNNGKTIWGKTIKKPLVVLPLIVLPFNTCLDSHKICDASGIIAKNEKPRQNHLGQDD
jgi:hypothetical protein